MMVWAAMATVKAVRSTQITDILWKKNRRPNCRVNRQVNRKYTIAQDVPHQPFSQILIILDDNSAFTEEILLLGWALLADYFSEWLWLYLFFWKVALALFITICILLFAREAISVHAAFTSSALLCEQFLTR